MTPIKQTVLFQSDAIGNGNCMAACFATLLDVPLWMVPPFEQMFGRKDWHGRVDEWLGRFFKLEVETQTPEEPVPAGEFYIAMGPSPRGVSHAVIYRDGKLVHDPHYSDAGISQVDWVWRLVPVQ